MNVWKVDAARCDIHNGEDVLFTTLPDEAKPGDALYIIDWDGLEKYKVEVEVVRETGWQKHKHLVRFRADRETAAGLRKALTYEVVR